MMKLHRHVPFRERFWKQVDKTDGCWLWTGALNGGYGLITVDGKSKRATHAAWFLETGSWPSGTMVCHHCDTPSCVRPSHLFLGTAKENNLDAIAKGRRSGWPRPSRVGALNGRSKLSVIEVDKIKASDRSSRELAQAFGVSKSTIHRIRRGEWGMTP